MKKREISNHFEAFLENATMGILVTNYIGEIAAINPFALKEFGYTDKELIGEKIEKLIPARFSKNQIFHREKYSEKAQNRNMGAEMVLLGLKKDGTEISLDVSLGNFYNHGDNHIIAFINHLPLSKQTAEIAKLKNELDETVELRTRKLKETLQELEMSRDKLKDVLSFQKALLDHAGAMIIATDDKGVIKLFNPEAALNLGYNQTEVIDKATPIIFHDKTEIARKRKELLDEFGLTTNIDFDVFVEKARRNIHEEEQYTYIRKDGTSFPVSLTITAINDNDGEITGFIGIAIDISEREKTEENLLQSLEKEKELNELKSRFVSMASHEFRTPLSTVLSSAYLIEKYTGADEQLKREKHLQRIVSSVGMLTDILNDFLSVGKIEEGKIQVRLSQFNIQELISTISEEIKNMLKKQQKIRYLHTGKPDVIMDASLLKHIVMNLVSNASKFSAEADTIDIKTISSEKHIILSVKDYGIGISKDDQKHLMERFFRGANAGHIQGTGLGLHIVSKYAELMNGTVECISELEKGTEFIITFNSMNLT